MGAPRREYALTRAASCGRLTPRERPPLLGPELREASALHEGEVAALSAELRSLRQRSELVAPRLQREVAESRLLRRDLGRVRREAQLCEGTLEAHSHERWRWEEASAEMAGRARQLETKADALARESGVAQRMLLVECEQEEWETTKDELIWELRQLDEESRAREQQADWLADAAVNRAADFGMPGPSGSAVLRGIARARDTAVELHSSLAATCSEARIMQLGADRITEELEEVRLRREDEQDRFDVLHAALSVSSTLRRTLVARAAEAIHRKDFALQTIADLSAECDVGSMTIRGQREDMDRVMQRQESFRHNIADVEASEDRSAVCHAVEVQAFVQLHAELRQELVGDSELQEDELSLFEPSEDPLDDLQLRVSEIREEFARAEASNRAASTQRDRTVNRLNERLAKLQHARDANALLVQSFQSSLDEYRWLEEQLHEERRVSEEQTIRTGLLEAERERTAEAVDVAVNHCEDTLALYAEDQDALLERESFLETQVASRDELQAGLTWDIAEASQELERLRGTTGVSLRELAAARHENASLSNLMSAGSP